VTEQICVPRLNFRQLRTDGGEPFARGANFQTESVGKFLGEGGELEVFGRDAERLGEGASRDSAGFASSLQRGCIRPLPGGDCGRAFCVAAAERGVQFIRRRQRVGEKLFLSA
jgi:hypothetical protein